MSYTNTLRRIHKYFKASCICTLLCISFSSNAQLILHGDQTAAALSSALTGPGVVVLNPTLNCYGAANAIFSTGAVSPINIPNGIVLSTGSAVDTTIAAYGTLFGVGDPSTNFADGEWGLPGDALLSAAAGGEVTNDACILEFDFIPAGDTVKFNYVFGSEEYTDFACSEFNDVFGFFISGNAYTTPTNLALVPGTNIPVCINSVNCGGTGGSPTSTCAALGPGSPFCTYYIDNTVATSPAYNYVTFDGLTTVLQCVAAVAPCDTYHLKMAIADGVDDAFDSGVFIEGGSLTSTGISVAPLGINPSDTGFGSQYCIRECTPGEFIFHATGSLADSTVIHFAIGGSAVNGYDYTTIADSVVIPAHDSLDTVLIIGLNVPPAGPKTVELYVYGPYTCSGGTPIIVDSAELIIYDSLYAQIITPDTTICLGQSVLINTAGSSTLTYSWSPAATLDNSALQSPTATPLATTTYTVLANYPGSGCLPSESQVTISIATAPTLNVGPPIQTVCLGNPLQINVDVSPLSSGYTYTWTPAAFLNSDTIPNPIVNTIGITDTEFVVTVFPNGMAACAVSDSFELQLIPGAGMAIYPGNTTITYGEHIQLSAANLEPGTLMYEWMPNDGTLTNANINDPIAAPLATTTYTVIGMSPFGCRDTLSETITVDQDMTECLPSAFTPNNDGLNDVFRLCNITYQKLIQFSIFNRWGQKVYDNTTDPTKGWDGKFNGEPQDIGVYNYVVIIARVDGSTKTYTGNVTLLR